MFYRKDFRYKNADFNGQFGEKLTKARDWLKGWQTKTNNLFVCGSTGCGKTYLVMAFLNEIAKQSRYIPPYDNAGQHYDGFWDVENIEYVVAKQLFDTVKRKFSTNDKTASDARDDIYTYNNIKLLIIDEFGLGYGTESELIELTELLDYRWKKGLPTVFLSNLGIKPLMEYLKDRASQRAFDGADYVEIKGTSLRTKPKEL